MFQILRKGKPLNVGKIITPITITNPFDPSQKIVCDVLVDTGASSLILPKIWRDKLGKIPFSHKVELETADQRAVIGEVCGPMRIQIKGFKPISNDVVFIDMEPKRGRYEALLGYIILEQSLAAVDMKHHRLVHVKYMDLKSFEYRLTA